MGMMTATQYEWEHKIHGNQSHQPDVANETWGAPSIHDLTKRRLFARQYQSKNHNQRTWDNEMHLPSSTAIYIHLQQSTLTSETILSIWVRVVNIPWCWILPPGDSVNRTSPRMSNKQHVMIIKHNWLPRAKLRWTIGMAVSPGALGFHIKRFTIERFSQC